MTPWQGIASVLAACSNAAALRSSHAFASRRIATAAPGLRRGRPLSDQADWPRKEVRTIGACSEIDRLRTWAAQQQVDKLLD
jgi:hypothetical protein